MDLIRHGDHCYTLHTNRSGARLTAYVVQLKQPYGDAHIPRFAARLDLPGTFATQAEAHTAALHAVEQLESGQLRPPTERIKKRVRDYELIASASFRTDQHKWQPVVRVVSHRENNRGSQQEFGDADSALARNLFDSPVTAAKYGLEFGERVVLGFIGGLHV